MDCLLNNTFLDIQNSGVAHTIGSWTHGGQLMLNLPNPSQQYSCEEIEKFLD